MPQKKNPVVIEHLKAKAAHVAAAFASAAACVRASHFTNTLDAHREGLSMVWGGLVETGRALALARIIAGTAEPRADLLLARARANYSTATTWPTSWFGTAASISARHTMSPARS